MKKANWQGRRIRERAVMRASWSGDVTPGAATWLSVGANIQATVMKIVTVRDMMHVTALKTCQASLSLPVWRYSENTGMNAELRAPPAIKKKRRSGTLKAAL